MPIVENGKMPDDLVAQKTPVLLSQIRSMVGASPSLESLQREIATQIAQSLSYCSWTGFYMLDPADPHTLVLGPFVGAPTPHVRIPVSQGICGAAVAADPRYLSCSIETRSEIVVPIYAHGHVAGEIDIDSHDPAAFTPADRLFLEEVARIVGGYIEQHP
jgi:L-methionine (R)-S-oxide reductase